MNSNARQTQFEITTHAMTCVLVFLACTITGCTICQDCGDVDYPAYGGAWERTRRDSGRVGSVFDPAGARVAVLSPRASDAEDLSIRDPGKNTTPDDDGFDRSDDPVKNKDTESSPSDKTKNSDDKNTPNDPESIRNLDLEDINMEDSDLLPPEV